MKGFKKALSIIALVVLIGTDFLNPISYAIEQEEVIFGVEENIELENEEENVDEINDEDVEEEEESEEMDEAEELVEEMDETVEDGDEGDGEDYTEAENSDFSYAKGENEENDAEGGDSGEIDLGDDELKLNEEEIIEEDNLEENLNEDKNSFGFEEKDDGEKDQKAQRELDKTDEVLEELNKVESEGEFVELKSFDNALTKDGEGLVLLDEGIGIKSASGSAEKDEPVQVRGVSGRGIMDQMPSFDYTGIAISRPNSLSSSYSDSPAVYIVMDRNLGASEPGRGVSSYGYLYQFGNNYGFSGEQTNSAINKREANVNLTEYSNSNPYYSGVFVLGLKENGTGTENDWAIVSNDNVWGYDAIKESDRQGPCPEGWHMPTKSEWDDLIAYWGGLHGSLNISDFVEYFKLPLPGSLSRSAGDYFGSSYGKEGYYRTTIATKGKNAYAFKITSTAYKTDVDENRVNGYSVRCFKNDDTLYTITYDDGVNDKELFSNQSGTGYRGDVYPSFNGSPEWVGENAEFLGWYKEVGGGYIQVNPVTAQITSDVVLYAKWSECEEGECVVPVEDETSEDVAQDLDIYFVVDDSMPQSHYTIMDRNPGATEAGTGSASFGYQYQWGNNHGFLSCGSNDCTNFPGGETMTSSLVTNALDYGPGNYYSGNVFIKNSVSPFDWADPKNDNLWGDTTDASGDNPSARQGPCDAGYHVPSSAEWLEIQNAWLGINDGNPNRCGLNKYLAEANACAYKIKNDLLLPSVGRRNHSDGKVGYIQSASYWTSSPSGIQGDGFYYNDKETTATNALKFSPENRTRARSVRCVKDVYNTPLTININGGTKASVSVYGGKLHYLTDPKKEGYDFGGRYSSLTGNIKIEDDGEINSSTRVLYAKWIRESDVEYKFYANGGTFEIEEGEDVVNSDTFVKTYEMGSDFDLNDVIEPKQEGYTFTGWYDSASGGNLISFPDIVSDSIIAYAHWDTGYSDVITGVIGDGSISDNSEGDYVYGKRIIFIAHPSEGYIFDKWIKNGEEILSGGSLELEITLTGDLYLTGYFVALSCESGTHLDNGACISDTETGVACTSELPANAQAINNTYTRTWNGSWSAEPVRTYNGEECGFICVVNHTWDGNECKADTYIITWKNEDGSVIDTTTVEYGVVPTHADANQPADAQYTYEFIGWTPTPIAATGDASYRATYKYIKNKYTITWLNEDGSLIDTTEVEYGEVPTHSNPTKPADDEYIYNFAGWIPELVAVTGEAIYTATYSAEKKEEHSESGGMSGGGGRGGNIDSEDNQHGSAEENLDGNEYTGDEVDDFNKDVVPLYKWSYENKITTIDTLEKADPDGLVTRGHLAKMVVNYMVNVLGRNVPYDVTYNCLYRGDNESSWESDEIRDYATKACAFGVMGINMENNEFLPNNIVTRAEFGTVMSRVLWGDKYDIIDTDSRMYYEDHLQALKKDDILTQINDPEARWEIRKWVWLVFRRITEKKKL